MKAQFLKISGHKNEKDFYKEFPTMDAFMAKHGAALKKAQYGYPLMQYPQQQPQPYVGPGFQKPPQDPNEPIFNPGSTMAAYGNPTTEAAKGQQTTGADALDPASLLKNSVIKPFDTNKAIKTGIGMVDSVVGGLSALKAEKKALQSARTWRDVSKVAKQASETEDVNKRTDIADTAARTRKALVPTINAEALFPTYGVGTNVLAKDGFKLPTGGLKRSEDYGSKSKPYASVSKGDFAGGGRSYPIPTIQDAGDALRLAGLHHRPDVKAKVYAKYPSLRKGQNGEIMNTFAPGDIYDDMGYEPMAESYDDSGYTPLSDADIVKAYRSGGLFPKAFFGMSSAMGGAGAGAAGKGFLGIGGDEWGSMANSATGMIGGAFGDNAGTQIGGGIGEGVGSIFGPVGGMAGKALGTLAGGLLDRNPAKTKKAQDEMMKNVNLMSGMNNIRGFQSSHAGVFRTGGNLRQNSVGDIEAVSGGNLEPLGYNPYSDGSGITSMIKGQTHEESNGKHTGVLLNYNKAQDGGSDPQVEAENNEPVTEIGQDAVIFGDMVINDKTVGGDPHFKPFYGKTFKKAMAGIAEQNSKLNKQQIKNTKALNDLEVKTPTDKLTLNSLSMNEKAIDTKYKFNDMIMKKAAAHQQIVNDEAERLGLNSGEYSRNKLETADNTARSGKRIAAEGDKLKKDIDPPKNSVGNVDPYTKYSVLGNQPGALDQNPVGPANPQEMFRSPEAYAKYKAETEAAYDDPEIAKQLVTHFLTYEGPDQEDVRSKMSSQKTYADMVRTAKGLATDYQPGRYHISTSQFKKAALPATPTPAPVNKDGVYETAPYNEYGWENLAAQALPWFRSQPGEGLLGDQLAGEMFALSHNQEEPVQARFLHPELDVPYDISYQDRLNENQATFNQLQRAAGSNPAALSSLAGQKYGADSNVLAEQFRANQAKKDQVYSGNRAILNQTQEKNLTIADQQYVRQAQAKSATKAVKQEALNSIAAKIGQNRLENRTLQTYANMFPDFSYDKNYRIRKTGAPTKFNMPVVYNAAGDITHVALYDKEGKIYDYKPLSEEESKEMSKKKTVQPSASTPPIVEDTKAKRHGGLTKAFKNL